MKANELIVGDIVLVDGIPRKVAQVTKRKIGYHLSEMECVMHYARLCEIRPVPITPQMLKANGFRYENGVHLCSSIYGDMAKDKGPHIEIVWQYNGVLEIRSWEVYNKTGITQGAVAFGYNPIAVHELIHILRMVGLNELAEKIKIKKI